MVRPAFYFQVGKLVLFKRKQQNARFNCRKRSSYMLSSLQPPAREIDVAFLVFIERYATDLLKWDILTFFAHNPDLYASASQVADQVKRSARSVRPELGDLALLGILNQKQMQEDGPTLYRLTQNPRHRKMALKFANQIALPASG